VPVPRSQRTHVLLGRRRAAGLTKHNPGQAEHADTTARAILSSSSLPIS
jgi:hypothetical protein